MPYTHTNGVIVAYLWPWVHSIVKTETEHKKFKRIATYGYQSRYGAGTLDSGIDIFSQCKGTTYLWQESTKTIRLQSYWPKMENMSSSWWSWHLNVRFLFCYGQNLKRRGEGSFLPNARHARGFLHQAYTGNSIHMNKRKDTKSSRWNKYCHAQECVGEVKI